MGLVAWLLIIGAALVVVLIGMYLLARYLRAREPYASFLQLPTRRKLVFFKWVATDRRVRWYAKAVPFVLAVYLASPIDLVPDFLPVIGYLDDVAMVLAALALVMKFTPSSVVDDLLSELASTPVPMIADEELT